MNHRAIALNFIISLCSGVALAGTGRIDADDVRRFSREDDCSVIVARIERVWVEKSKDDNRPKDHSILTPIATLAGTFDATSVETLEVEFYSGAPTTSIDGPPKAASLVMAVVRVQTLVHDDPIPRNLIVSENCMFMPGSSSLVAIKGLDDPLVIQTIERIRKRRAAARAKQEALEREGEDRKTLK